MVDHERHPPFSFDLSSLPVMLPMRVTHECVVLAPQHPVGQPKEGKLSQFTHTHPLTHTHFTRTFTRIPYPLLLLHPTHSANDGPASRPCSCSCCQRSVRLL